MKTTTKILNLTGMAILFVLILSLALWSFTVPGHSTLQSDPGLPGTIKGHVYPVGTNTSIPDVSLILLQDGSKIMETKTDRNGFFELTGITVGDYSITAEKAGYEPFTRKTIHVLIKEAIEINIYLKPTVESQIETTTETLPNSKMRELRSKHALTGNSASGVNIGGIGFVSYCEESYYDPSFNTESYDLIQETGMAIILTSTIFSKPRRFSGKSCGGHCTRLPRM
ncbi:MAG: carboxypeptidase regulatory-like domain-containing protein [Bacteroidetes bacterium]|nr:carboxypeptidase regulatory-like domain-containing protein [Bacteroidota bacterium]